jgi:hypothetical protein
MSLLNPVWLGARAPKFGTPELHLGELTPVGRTS